MNKSVKNKHNILAILIYQGRRECAGIKGECWGNMLDHVVIFVFTSCLTLQCIWWVTFLQLFWLRVKYLCVCLCMSVYVCVCVRAPNSIYTLLLFPSHRYTSIFIYLEVMKGLIFQMSKTELLPHGIMSGSVELMVDRSTHTAVQGSGCLPQCSTPRRLPGLGVLSCSVLQHCCAPHGPWIVWHLNKHTSCVGVLVKCLLATRQWGHISWF